MAEALDQPTGAHWRSATELVAAYRRRELSPVEVVTALLDRIGTLNPKLSAYLAVDRAGALQAAEAAERVFATGAEVPLLCGVPVSLKDSIEYAGLPTTYGSLAFADNRCEDSLVAERLRAAGAVILGKTNLPEFATGWTVRNRLGHDGRNPWNLSRTCGGSSGGAAAAVAAGLGPIAIGTDSSGSVRVPAAYNGVFGLKPTFQRIPAVQRWRASPLRSHTGSITRTVADSELALRALAGPDPRDPSSALPPLAGLGDPHPLTGTRVGVLRSTDDVAADSHSSACIDKAAVLLADFGCHIGEPDEPLPVRPGRPELAPGVWAYSGDHYAAAEALRPGFWERHADDLTDYARRNIDAGRRALAWQYRRVLDADRQYGVAVRQWLSHFDFVLAPAAGPAPPLTGDLDPDDDRRRLAFNTPFNIAHVPAAVVPFDVTDDGLPIAIQLVAPHGNDAVLLALCRAVEERRPWANRLPPIHRDMVG